MSTIFLQSVPHTLRCTFPNSRSDVEEKSAAHLMLVDMFYQLVTLKSHPPSLRLYFNEQRCRESQQDSVTQTAFSGDTSDDRDDLLNMSVSAPVPRVQTVLQAELEADVLRN